MTQRPSVLFNPSSMPFVIWDFFQATTPSQWDLMVFAAFIIGSKRL